MVIYGEQPKNKIVKKEAVTMRMRKRETRGQEYEKVVCMKEWLSRVKKRADRLEFRRFRQQSGRGSRGLKRNL